MKLLLPAGLILAFCVGAVLVWPQLRARARIGAAREELAQSTSPRVPPADGVGFDLRHPPFGIFNPWLALPIDELFEELAAHRRIVPERGLEDALPRLAGERRFLTRVRSMLKDRYLGPEDVARLLQRFRTEWPRPPIADAFLRERLNLIRVWLRRPPATALLTAQGLNEIDALHQALEECLALSPQERLQAVRSWSRSWDPESGVLHGGPAAVAWRVLQVDAEIEDALESLGSP